MKRKFLAGLILSALLASLSLEGFAQTRGKKPRKKANRPRVVLVTPRPEVESAEVPPPLAPPSAKVVAASSETIAARASLLASLPKSDAVAFVDLKRILNDALPVILASNPAQLAQVNAQLDKVKQQTGLDLRSFERVATGIRLTPNAGGFDATPFTLINGSFNAGALIAAGRFAAQGKYQQEEYKGKQLYLFSLGDALKDIPLLGSLGANLALMEVDANTLAVGDAATLKANIDANGDAPRANSDLVAMATRNPNALIGLGANIPADAAKSLGLDVENDEMGKTAATIRQMAASLGLNDGGAEILMAARADKDSDAKNIADTLNALKQFAGFAVGQLKTPEQQKLAMNAIQTLKVAQSGNEAQLSLAIRREDFPALLGLIK